MNKIKLLTPDQAQKIAAGEVIERPANIVKELLENAIDAQATSITLFFEKYGKQLIHIIDNGCGMTQEDARMCFLPHATSKITSIDELTNITSFGFRGEALASIAAISKVELTTKTAEATTGIHIKYAEGTITQEMPVASNVGTDIKILDVFYNVPVRKKFLKQDETEWNQILSLFYAFCLSHQEIAFKLYHNSKLLFNFPSTQTLKDRITQIWDYNFTQQLLPLINSANTKDTLPWLQLNGFITNHHFWRYGKNNIFFFVNNRWIKNQNLTKALLKGYLNVLPPGKFPAGIIFLTIDKTLVDINCHPKKEEVRFTKPATVDIAIFNAVKKTLENQVITTFSSSTRNKELPLNTANSFLNFSSDQMPSPPLNDFPLPTLSKQPQVFNVYTSVEIPPHITSYQEDNVSRQTSPQFLEEGSYILIGQLFNTYILLETKQGLVLLDQHAAHERILYEKFLKNFEKKEGTQLLFPEVITLTSGQILTILKEQTFFNNQGIELEQIGQQEIVIKTAPPYLNNTSLKELILDSLNFIEENEHLDKELFRKKLNEHVHSHMACKAAIKAGDVLTPTQIHQLIKDLQKTDKCFICIHGRPTMWNISKDDIEKNFRRR